jgi:hypothetical protein
MGTGISKPDADATKEHAHNTHKLLLDGSHVSSTATCLFRFIILEGSLALFILSAVEEMR